MAEPRTATVRRGGAAGALAAALAGAASWTLAEYGLHRFLMHEMRGRGMASKEHLRHHADVTYFSPAWKKTIAASAATTVVLPSARAVTGIRRAIAYTGGLIGMYLVYETVHRRCHTHPPRTRHGRWMRRNHLYHHVANPMGNHGVTTGIWDRAFGTYDEPGVVTVPRRLAPDWLLEDNGDVLAPYRDDYRARGKRSISKEQADRDWERAFANLTPDP